MTCMSIALSQLASLPQAGGKLQQHSVTSLTEIAHYDMVINCGGLRGGKLFGDSQVIPVRYSELLHLILLLSVPAAYHIVGLPWAVAYHCLDRACFRRHA